MHSYVHNVSKSMLRRLTEFDKNLLWMAHSAELNGLEDQLLSPTRSILMLDDEYVKSVALSSALFRIETESIEFE